MGMKEGNSSVLSYADVLMYYDVETIHHGWNDSTYEKNSRWPELSEMVVPIACSRVCLCHFRITIMVTVMSEDHTRLNT